MDSKTLNAILSGDCTLFTGAGFSSGAQNIQMKPVPVGSGLAKILYDDCGMDSDDDLNMSSMHYKDKFGEDGLIKKLRETFYVSEPTDDQIFITSLRWRSIYTTNYDNVIESCLSRSGIVPKSTGIDTSPSHFNGRNNLVVHVNGSIEELKDQEPVPSSFKLSNISYATDDFLKSSWHIQLQQDIYSSEYTVFIGCSLRSDLDLTRILQRANESGPRRRAIFIVRSGENATVINNLKPYGFVFEIGLDGFVRALKEQQKVYVPRQHTELTTFSFHKYQRPQHTKFASKEQAFDLLFGGRINTGIFFHSVQQPSSNPYYFSRKAVELMQAEINRGEKNLLVISGIGNGKSIAVEALAYALLQDDYQVFRYEKAYESLNLELEHINRQQKPVVILESYAQNKDFLERLLIHRTNKSLVLVVTERTALYETSIQTLVKLTNNADFALYDINNLDETDIVNFSQLLTTHGLWGNDTTLAPSDKIELIRKQCHSTTREVLLRLLESENIISKFSAILNALQVKKDYYQAIILILTASRFNVVIDLPFVNQVLNTLNIRSTNFDNNLAIKELIDFKHNEIKIRSSIVSEALLEHVSEIKPLIDALVEICSTIDEWEDETSKALLREYMSYSNLKWMLDRKGKDINDTIFHFFESIRNLNSCRNNHHYWLQCAILDIERQEFALAHKHLETAYSLASKKRLNYDTYQIDNQVANLLLKEVIAQKDANSAMLKFKEAHRTLTRTADPNRLRHYPYKVASLYIKFHNVFFEQLNASQKHSLIDAFEEMVRRMDDYLRQVTHYREKRFVGETRAELVQLINNYRKSQSAPKT